MPHDRLGNLIEEGATVSVWAKVKSVQAHDDYCNVTLETLEPVYPGKDKTTITLNARQVELVDAPLRFLKDARDKALLQETKT